jgi:hypothetical protein
MARNVAWLAGLLWRFMTWIAQRKEAPVFDVPWRFYDAEPTQGNAVGVALFQRTWRSSVRGKWIRTRERSAPKRHPSSLRWSWLPA